MTVYILKTDKGYPVSQGTCAVAARSGAQRLANQTRQRTWVEFDVAHNDGRPVEQYREVFTPEAE